MLLRKLSLRPSTPRECNSPIDELDCRLLLGNELRCHTYVRAPTSVKEHEQTRPIRFQRQRLAQLRPFNFAALCIPPLCVMMRRSHANRKRNRLRGRICDEVDVCTAEVPVHKSDLAA